MTFWGILKCCNFGRFFQFWWSKKIRLSQGIPKKNIEMVDSWKFWKYEKLRNNNNNEKPEV